MKLQAKYQIGDLVEVQNGDDVSFEKITHITFSADGPQYSNDDKQFKESDVIASYKRVAAKKVAPKTRKPRAKKAAAEDAAAVDEGSY